MTAFRRTALTHAPHHTPARPAPTRRTSARHRGTALGLVAVGALLLAACGSDGDDAGMNGMNHASGTSSAAAPSGAAGSGGFNDADVTFAQTMIPHHRQALEMAELADGRASDAGIKDLAGAIEKAQDPEISIMTGWLKSWGRPTTADSMAGMDMAGDGMMSGKDMTELKAMKGREFDTMFARMMIDHHHGAIAMARTERSDGENTDTKKLAGDIVTGQSAEVKRLRSILDRL
ncbi:MULTISPECIES: DUF305 domain-containing protein [unclassified Streptomyces]|uniref:DUF305 domain-containing protein n=1 Tax=unclassified Streptomyces TaxID=2593676 RepID=UPI00224C7CD6|nr:MULTISPECIES: DUF305 domain-containing protein [unclassified Streptomyces]MCX4987813.1 DUF305 domain-containing protein [Streptomyces sp. NBC_00568]MCX5007054.1 DUF305 domain-containing protein [Streptomyces sp. NBC_00638]